MKRLLIPVAAAVFVAYLVANLVEVFREYDRQADIVDRYDTGPGWRR